MSDVPSGWYPNPEDQSTERWWMGTSWSDETRPLAPGAVPPPPPSYASAGSPLQPGSDLGAYDMSTAQWQISGATISSGGRRFGAYLLDILLAFVTLFIGWMIWSLIVWSKGQSPGKQLMGMRCIDIRTGRAAGWGTMALREIVGKSILGSITFGITTFVSCFMILAQPRQGIWDKVANTTVVDDPEGLLLDG